VKRLLSLLLAAVLIFAFFAACRDDDGPAGPGFEPGREPGPNPTVLIDGQWIQFTQPPAPVVPGRPTTPSGILTIGENTMDANFFAGWTNSAGNARVRELIGGYDTVVYTSGGNFVINPMAVKAIRLDVNADQSRTYTIELHDNLVWNDGQPLTAEDYVFNFLYSYAPIVWQTVADGGLGQNRLSGGNIYRGFFAYRWGRSDVFTGARLIDRNTFSVTVEYVTQLENAAGDVTGTQANFPNWWEVLNYSVGAIPRHVIAPNARVVDTGNGIRMEGEWNIDVLRATVDNGSVGYRYTPYVTAGPYQFVRYSESDGQATVRVNPLFLGNYVGYKPVIEHLVVRTVPNPVIVAEFTNGQVDVVMNVGGGDPINALLDYSDLGHAQWFDVLRNGYGFIDFKHHVYPTKCVHVRRAIAYCLDRGELGRQFTGGHGRVVHSQVGYAQWMYTQNADLVDSRLHPYSVNVEEAIRELVEGGWVFDAQGNPFVQGVSALPRHKRDASGALVPLHIYWFAANAQIGAIGESLLASNFVEAGMTYTMHHDADGAVFSAAVQGRSDPVYNMVSRGATFATAHSPWLAYDPDPAAMPHPNSNFISDQKLYDLAMALRNTAPGDNETYFERWLEYVVYFNEILPDLPLYSDIWYTFFPNNLHNFLTCSVYPWSSAILRSWIG
jgi:peptide/nickel transport system substrate-binding protein